MWEAVSNMLLKREKNDEIPLVWTRFFPWGTKWLATKRIEMMYALKTQYNCWTYEAANNLLFDLNSSILFESLPLLSWNRISLTMS